MPTGYTAILMEKGQKPKTKNIEPHPRPENIQNGGTGGMCESVFVEK